MRSSAPLGPAAVNAGTDDVDVSVAAGLVGGAESLHSVGLPPMAADAPGVPLGGVCLAQLHYVWIADGIGEGLMVEPARDLYPTGACEFHLVAGLGVAQVLAALIVAAVVDLDRVAQSQDRGRIGQGSKPAPACPSRSQRHSGPGR